MKAVTLIALASLFIFEVQAYDMVTVNGKIYVCENMCSINTGPPTTVSDSEGGYVGEVQRDAVEIT